MLLVDTFISKLGNTKPWPPLNGYSLFVFGSGFNQKKYFNNVFDVERSYDILNVKKSGLSQTFLPEEVIHDFSKEVFTKHLKNAAALPFIKEKFYKNFNELDTLYEKFTYEHIKNNSEEDLLPTLAHALDLIWESNAWSHFTIYFDLDFCYEIASHNYPNITKDEIESMWHRATESWDESFDKAQKRFYLSQIIAGKSKDEIVESCQYFLATYKGVSSLTDIEKLIDEQYSGLSTVDVAQAEIEKMDFDLAASKESYVAWKSSLSPVLQNIADYCQTVMQVRDHRKNFFAKGLVVAWRIGEKVFTKAGVPITLVENALPFDEIMKGSDYIALIQADLEKRKDNYVVYVPYDSSIQISYDDIQKNYDTINSFFVSDEEKLVKTIKGQIGNKGDVTGIARVIKTFDEFNKFNDGEVLVTGMTRPEFVPLMKKAVAIITDEGGITCHAAIVSRELKIPCVIGTKIASQVIKSGDTVHVNANTGIVTIL